MSRKLSQFLLTSMFRILNLSLLVARLFQKPIISFSDFLRMLISGLLHHTKTGRLFPISNKRVVKTPKLYFLDTGLAAWLTEWTSPATLEAGAMSGAILESWVVSEIIKSWWHNGKRAPIYYYRDKDTKEIDLLIHQNGTLYPVEIKKSANPGKEAIRHFEVLQTLKQPIGQGCIISLAPMYLPITSTIDNIPVGMV